MAITITPGATEGDLNGTTPVTAVAAPAAGTSRTVLSIRVFNRDTAIVTVTLSKKKGATTRSVEKVVGLAVDGTWPPVKRDSVIVLDATDETVEVVMDGAPATNQPYFEVAWLDRLVV